MQARPRTPVHTSRFVPMIGLPAARRATPDRRVPHRVPCRVRVLNALGGGWSAIGETVQLAHDAVVVHIGRWIEPGATVEVLVPHLEGDPACLYGVVMSSRRAATGCFEIGITLTLDNPDRGRGDEIPSNTP